MASVPATDPFIVFAPDVPEEEGHYPPPFEKERVGFWRNLGKATGSRASASGSTASRPARARCLCAPATS